MWRKFGLLLLTIVILVLAERISQFHEETPRILFENILGAFIMWLIVLLLGWRD